MSLIRNYWDVFRSDKLKEKFEEIDNTIYVEEVELTADQIIGMNAAPVTVVAAKGSGKVLELVGVVAIFDYGTVQFTGGGDVTLAEETSGTSLSAALGVAVIQAAADSITKVLSIGATLSENKAIQITNATAPFATGDGVLRLKIAYRVHNTGL